MRHVWMIEARRKSGWKRQPRLEREVRGYSEALALGVCAAESRRLAVPLRLTRVMSEDCRSVAAWWVERGNSDSPHPPRMVPSLTRSLLVLLEYASNPKERAKAFVAKLNANSRTCYYRLGHAPGSVSALLEPRD